MAYADAEAWGRIGPDEEPSTARPYRSSSEDTVAALDRLRAALVPGPDPWADVDTSRYAPSRFEPADCGHGIDWTPGCPACPPF